jgi:hypothetical protein
MRYVLHRLPYANKDVSRIRPLDLLLVGRAHVVYERGERHDNPLIWYGQALASCDRSFKPGRRSALN